jgi:hypothetical protein
MLVVEGAADEELLGGLCKHGAQQVFAAGNRELVEQLLRHIRANPVDGCDCLYLIDCDGYGKTADLREEASLVVSQTCDMEADLIHLGAALRLTSRFTSSEAEAEGLVERACAVALPLSIVRRAAFRCSISMRRGKGQLRLADFPDLQLLSWDENAPSPMEVLDSVASELGWSSDQRAAVAENLTDVPDDFRRTCMGKDALDALFRILRQEGAGEVKGWSLGHFYKTVARELNLEDLEQWEVGRRLKAWEAAVGRKLVADRTEPTGLS